jgi:hypothetical protein
MYIPFHCYCLDINIASLVMFYAGLCGLARVLEFLAGHARLPIETLSARAALVNTAAGLSVAMPSLAMHHFFRYRMVNIGITLERQVGRLLDETRSRTHAGDQSHAH